MATIGEGDATDSASGRLALAICDAWSRVHHYALFLCGSRVAAWVLHVHPAMARRAACAMVEGASRVSVVPSNRMTTEAGLSFGSLGARESWARGQRQQYFLSALTHTDIWLEAQAFSTTTSKRCKTHSHKSPELLRPPFSLVTSHNPTLNPPEPLCPVKPCSHLPMGVPKA